MKYNRLILITILTFVLCGSSSLSQTQSAAHDYETHTNNLVERSGLFDLKQEGTEGIQHLPVTCKKRLAATMEKNEVMDIFLFEISPACNVLEVDFAGKEYYTLVAGPTSIANIDITDLDGDGLNEIVAYYIYANGSKAQYLDIYKFDEDGLRQIFSYEMFSSGFYIESEDIYAYSIKNEYTPFEKLYIWDFEQTEDWRYGWQLDSHGNIKRKKEGDRYIIPVKNASILSRFQFQDIDTDGASELVIEENFGFGDNLGCDYFILKWDDIAAQMKVIKADFYDYEELDKQPPELSQWDKLLQ